MTQPQDQDFSQEVQPGEPTGSLYAEGTAMPIPSAAAHPEPAAPNEQAWDEEAAGLIEDDATPMPAEDTYAVAEPITAAPQPAQQPMSQPAQQPAPAPQPAQQPAQQPAPAAPAIDLAARPDSTIEIGSTTRLSWAARTDVGLVRGHNEDSYLVKSPLFGVCDGMGGHAAGEVASALAVRAISEHAPEHADDPLLGAAVEAANEAVIDGAATGVGKPGMGCTASVAIIEDAHMAIAHVGDSRIYLLRAGTLVRLTHDHSYVEELVDAGEITADEARVHPSRSIITRALGSDPDMYADHFSLDVERGDRIIVCSDGLSSMVRDGAIEALAVSSATAADCTDALVSAALAEGGHDNVTVIVVDVVSDGREEARRRALMRGVVGWLAAVMAVVAVVAVVLALIVNNSWYVGAYAGNVGIFRGVRGNILGIELSHLERTTEVALTDLPESTQHQLAAGIDVASEAEAEATIEAYQAQIADEQQKKRLVASGAQSDSSDGTVGSATGASGPEAATQDRGGE